MKILRSSLPALALAALSFPVWQHVFSRPDLPIQVQIAANDARTVKAYWDNPTVNPTSYAEISVQPVQIPAEAVASNVWRIKVEALAEKEPDAKSAEVWLVDVRTPEKQVNWSKVSMGAQKWTLIDNPYGPQGKIAAAQVGKPQSLEAVVKGGNLTITLLRSAWSGKVRVTANDQVREINLYAAKGAVEKLSFEPTEVEAKKTKTYEIKVVKVPWTRLKFISESPSEPNGIQIKSIKVENQVILPDAKNEFALPFYFWNRLSCTIVATALSFLGLIILIISIEHPRRRRNTKSI